MVVLQTQSSADVESWRGHHIGYDLEVNVGGCTWIYMVEPRLFG